MHKKGFSLLELIVAIGVFAVVATIAVGALLGLSTAQKKAFYIQTNQDNIRFALETMARELRTGICYKQLPADNSNVCVGFAPPTPCTDSQCIQFVNSHGDVVVYKRSINQGECGINPPVAGLSVECIAKNVNGIGFYPVTAREVKIHQLKFTLSGQDSSGSDPVQSRVTIFMQADTPGASALNTQLEAQTTISQLQLDSGSL